MSAVPLPVSTTYMEIETQGTKENISLPPFLTLHLFLPASHSYKGWDHYKCHADRWELSITLLELQFVGFAATQFTALLKCGWAKQAANYSSPTHWWQGPQMRTNADVKVVFR